MSQFQSQSYDVPRTTGVCASTERELQPGEAYYAALVELSDEELAEVQQQQGEKSESQHAAAALGLRRVDISMEAWEQGYRPDRLFSFWKSTIPEPTQQKKKLFVDDAVLMNLLHRLADAEEPKRLAFRYVLALILMRKKLLRFDGAETRQAEVEGETVDQEWWLLTPKKDLSKGPLGKWDDENTIELLDPRLDESQIEEVTQQLGEILEAEL